MASDGKRVKEMRLSSASYVRSADVSIFDYVVLKYQRAMRI